MKQLLLIDANSFIHRAFYAIPPFTGPQGQPTGALYGLLNTLLKILKDQKPDYVAAAFDRPEPTFRKKKFEDYKAHRPKTPNELISQIKDARELFKILNIPTFETAGFEADDIIGTLVNKLKKEGLQITILTGDHDILQLVDKNKVIVKTPKRSLSDIKIYNEGAVRERFNVTPSQITDYKGLVGDTSDNIPGIPNIGPKTAAKILKEFKSVESLYKKMKDGHPLAKKVLPHKDTAILSKELATIDQNVPVKISIKNLEYKKPETRQILNYCQKLGFRTIAKRLSNKETAQKSRAPRQNTPVHNSDIEIITSAETLNADALKSDKVKVAYDWKEIIKKSKNEVKSPIFDIKIAGWLLDPDKKKISLEILSKRFLNKNLINADTPENLDDLHRFLKAKIKEYELENVFYQIEMPLIKILAEMEKKGIGINTKKLETLNKEMGEELKSLEKKIYKETGAEFNINSPKQVSEIIFEKLKITHPKIRTTSTGQKSTAEETLNIIKDAHPTIPLLLEYRESFKIKTTYVEPLLALNKNGRIHTTFLQTGTATGRLSSEKPNLQNIPQTSKWAKELRSAFEAGENKSLLSFDYSQLELRLLAHISKDRELKTAFDKGEDIHRLTASKIFKIPIENITGSMRRLGKTLNFGIVYGMGALSLSKTGDIPLKEARLFIQEYFQNFPAIKIWQEQAQANALSFGFAKTESGRRRFFPYAASEHPKIQSDIKRMAINTPIQGLGADIIKLAMIKTSQKVDKKSGQLLLSIHDELLFEVSNDTLKETACIIKNCMEKAYPLSTPLKVDVKIGKNWGMMSITRP